MAGGDVKYKISAILLVVIWGLAGVSYAADDPTSLGTQAGTAARELKGAADESFSTGAMKVAEASGKVQAEAQETLKTLQQQWDILAKQLREKTRQMQKQLQTQWEDFNKSLNQP